MRKTPCEQSACGQNTVGKVPVCKDHVGIAPVSEALRVQNTTANVRNFLHATVFSTIHAT